MEYKFASPKKPFANKEEEIKYLQNLIAEKEAALNNIGIKKDDLQPARQLLAEYKVVPEKQVLEQTHLYPIPTSFFISKHPNLQIKLTNLGVWKTNFS